MTGMQIFFILYFGIMAACVAHHFVFCNDAASEFLGKFLGGVAGAWAVTLLFAARSASLQGTWYMPMAGAFVGALFVAATWKVLANREREHTILVKAKHAVG